MRVPADTPRVGLAICLQPCIRRGEPERGAARNCRSLLRRCPFVVFGQDSPAPTLDAMCLFRMMDSGGLPGLAPMPMGPPLGMTPGPSTSHSKAEEPPSRAVAAPGPSGRGSRPAAGAPASAAGRPGRVVGEEPAKASGVTSGGEVPSRIKKRKSSRRKVIVAWRKYGEKWIQCDAHHPPETRLQR